MRLTASRTEQKTGHNSHYLTDTGLLKDLGLLLRYSYYSPHCILSWLSASRQYVLLVLANPPNRASGNLLRVILFLILLLICSSRVYVLGIIYPWPLVIGIVAALMLAHHRIALQRKVLGTIRLDTLLITSWAISLLPAAVHGLPSLIVGPSSEGIIFLLWDIFDTILGAFMFVLLLISIILLGYDSLLKKITQTSH